MSDRSPEPTSLTLLKRLIQGGSDADWQRLLTLYRPFIGKWIQSFPRLNDQADDILQEVLIVVMRELPAFEHRRTGSFRKWLRLITLHQLQAAVRRNRRNGKDVIDRAQSSRIEELADPSSSLSKQWDAEHDLEILEGAQQLIRSEVQPRTWEAFQRYAVDGKVAAEVAAELGMTVNSVMLAKARVMRRIRETVNGLIDDAM